MKNYVASETSSDYEQYATYIDAFGLSSSELNANKGRLRFIFASQCSLHMAKVECNSVFKK